VWYEHLARPELPFPSLADVGYLLAIPLAAAAMLAFPGRAERAALQARSLLDGAVIASSLLYTSWALVLGPVFRAGEGGVLEQASSHEVAVRVAERILEAMGPPFVLQRRQVRVGASVGVTVSEASEVDAVLREADVAMYMAKAHGKGRFELAASSA
jgi:GGDEF domain-containing protein